MQQLAQALKVDAGIRSFFGQGGEVEHHAVVLEEVRHLAVLRLQFIRQLVEIGRFQTQRQQRQAGALDLESGGAAAGQGNGHGRESVSVNAAEGRRKKLADLNSRIGAKRPAPARCCNKPAQPVMGSVLAALSVFFFFYRK